MEQSRGFLGLVPEGNYRVAAAQTIRECPQLWCQRPQIYRGKSPKLITFFHAIPRFQVQDVPAASVKRILQQNNVEDISEQRHGGQPSGGSSGSNGSGSNRSSSSTCSCRSSLKHSVAVSGLKEVAGRGCSSCSPVQVRSRRCREKLVYAAELM